MPKLGWVLALALVVGFFLWPRIAGPAKPALDSAPLAERAAATPPVRFARRDASTTGVDFQNELSAHNNFTYINNGAGLAVGDYDGDGWPDLYLVRQDGPNALYRQVAPWQFEDTTASAGGVDGGAAWGTGATFVDVDGDGWLDLYVCNLEAPNLLYRNRGDGTFVEEAGPWGLDRVAASTMAAFVDYDRDGDLDVYLLANRVFSPELAREIRDDVTPPADTRKTTAEMQPDLPVGDEWLRYYDQARDRWEFPEAFRDHFVFESGRPFYGGQPDRLMRNDGQRFTDVTEAAGFGRDQGMGLSATWWDMDDDGWLDLYVANDLESRDRLWRNQGDGTFVEVTEQALPHVAYFGMGSDFADVDGDGHFDFMVADMASTTHLKGKWLMGEMSDRGWFLKHARPQQYMRNSLFLNTGTGRFGEAAFLTGVAATDWTWAVRFGDLDNDGWEDLFVTNGIARFDNDPDLKPRLRALLAEGRRNEVLDLVRNIPAWAEPNLAFRNNGALHFDKMGAAWGLDHEGVSHGAALADLDRDGDLDVVALHLNEPIGLYENLTGTDDGRGVLVELRGAGRNPFAIGARVTLRSAGRSMTRLNVPARGYLSGQEPVVHFGLGRHDDVEHLQIHWPDGSYSELEHLPVGHRLVIHQPEDAAPKPAPEASPGLLRELKDATGLTHVHREREFDDFEAQPLLPWRLSRLGPALATGDVNGDGRGDWFVGGAAGQPAALLVSVGPDRWEAAPGPWTLGSEGEDLDAVFFDADGDGDLDLYVARGGVEVAAGQRQHQDRLFRNDGGSFEEITAQLPPHPHPSAAVAAGDADGDGDLDLFVGGFAVPGEFPKAGASRILTNNGGRFTLAALEAQPLQRDMADQGLVTDAHWLDVDGDGREDLLTVGWWRSPRLWLQTDSGLVEATERWGLSALEGWWNCIVPWPGADGAVDLVLGNFGTNHKYKANPEHPLILYCADFDGDGRGDLVESKWEGERHLPVRGRSCSSRAMPFLAEKFETYEAFANADLAGIYGASLDTAEQRRATELRHVVLRRSGEGFAVSPLPTRAQLAPVFDGAAIGLDPAPEGARGASGGEPAGVGPHLVLGQNFFSPEPETGRMDGGVGVVLRRTEDGGIRALSPIESGLVAPGDTKGVAWDGRVLVFAENNGPIRAWAPRSGGSAPQASK